MAGKIQRNNKTNKVSKKAKHARRTRRVSRKNNKSLNKRKQRKGGSFMSLLGMCNTGIHEKPIEITDMSGNSIEGKTFKNNQDEAKTIDKICKGDNGVFFISNKTRIEMNNFIGKYPEYKIENEKYIKYKLFESENGNYKLIEDTDKDNKTSFFNRFNPFKSSTTVE